MRKWPPVDPPAFLPQTLPFRRHRHEKRPELPLHRETIRRLSGEPLSHVVGGETLERSCYLSCFRGCSDVGCTDTCPSQIVPTGCGEYTDCVHECV